MLLMPMSEPLFAELALEPKRSIGLSPPPFTPLKLFLVLFTVDAPTPGSKALEDESILVEELVPGWIVDES